MANGNLGPNEHAVTVRVPGILLGNADIELEVRKGEDFVGRFQISKGSVEFVPSGKHANADGYKDGFKVTWLQLVKLMSQDKYQSLVHIVS